MKLQYYFVCLLCISSLFGFSQESDSLALANKNGITKPSILSVHPFGIFFSRIQGNFRMHTTKANTLTLGLESGNVWGSPIKTYIPNDESVRNQVRDIYWDQVQYFFDGDTINTKDFELEIDGVIKSLKANATINIAEKHELNFGLRLFMLTKGKAPLSGLTSDGFIESFHSNVAGGEDPYDRLVFGYDKAKIKYTDRNGNTLELNNGSSFIGGLETSYYYYPESLTNENKTFAMNFGAHLGTNLSKYNTSMDFGLSANSVKAFLFNDRNYFQMGLSMGVLRKNIVEFKSTNLDFGTNQFIAYLESALEYNYVSTGGTTHSFGANFYLQTSLNKKDELNYMIAVRHPDAHKAWAHGVWNLYTNNNYWTFMYSFTKKNTLTLYLQQDFTVNNNPDIQTGISYSFQL